MQGGIRRHGVRRSEASEDHAQRRKVYPTGDFHSSRERIWTWYVGIVREVLRKLGQRVHQCCIVEVMRRNRYVVDVSVQSKDCVAQLVIRRGRGIGDEQVLHGP